MNEGQGCDDPVVSRRSERKQDECEQGECDEEDRILEENLHIAYVSSALRLYSKNASVISEKLVSSFWGRFLLFGRRFLLLLLPREVRCSLVLAPG